MGDLEFNKLFENISAMTCIAEPDPSLAPVSKMFSFFVSYKCFYASVKNDKQKWILFKVTALTSFL